jgi:hypothetical protein
MTKRNRTKTQEDSTDDQEIAAELPAVEIVGPPGYASPDPKTESGRLVPIEDHPLSDDLSDDYGGNLHR